MEDLLYRILGFHLETVIQLSVRDILVVLVLVVFFSWIFDAFIEWRSK